VRSPSTRLALSAKPCSTDPFLGGLLPLEYDVPSRPTADCRSPVKKTSNMKFEIDKPEIVEFIGALKHCGEVVSTFMKFSPTVMPSREFASPTPLVDLLRHPEFVEEAVGLGEISSKPIHYSTLNRLEFEGSLASVLVEGGCFRNSISVDAAKKLAVDVLAAAFPKPFDDLLVFRLDDPSWSQFTDVATVSHTYFAWQGARGLWWMLSVADTD